MWCGKCKKKMKEAKVLEKWKKYVCQDCGLKINKRGKKL